MKLLFSIVACFLLHTAVGQKKAVHRLMNIEVETFDSGLFRHYGTHRFYYSGNRGGVLNGVDRIEYLLPSKGYHMLFDEAVPTLQYDSTIVTTHHMFWHKAVQQFDGTGKLLNFRRYFSTVNNDHLLFSDSLVYDDSGRLQFEYTRGDLFSTATIHYNKLGLKDTVISHFGSIIYVYDADKNIKEKIIKEEGFVEGTTYTYEVIGGEKKLVSAVTIVPGSESAGIFYSYSADSVWRAYMENNGGEKWDGGERTLHVYDSLEHPVFAAWGYTKGRDENWLPRYAMYYQYNSKGLLETATQKIWDEKTNTWQDNVGNNSLYNPAVRIKFSYDTILVD